MEKKCLQCQRGYNGYRNSNYCSIKCKQKSYRDRKKQEEKQLKGDLAYIANYANRYYLENKNPNGNVIIEKYLND